MLVPDLIAERTVFFWQAKPKDSWAGFSQRQILELVQNIALLLGITNENAELLRIVFADHEASGKGDVKVAVLLAKYTKTLKYVESLAIIVNRSMEVFKSRIGVQESYGQKSHSQKGIEEESLVCVLETPLECVIWILAEELAHSKLVYMAKTRQNDRTRNSRYQEIRRKKRQISECLYEDSYQEMTVARQCLRVLMKLVPENAAYYRKVYEYSVKRGNRPIPYVTDQAKSSTFVNTGYNE
ncbi:MAG: hypothetical protein BroJett025_09120 [Patescibacteria group bacterium]|nr:MAG: hypothetical protein BroJett025_09120 [Patescibacteria group bacterium]